MISTSTFRRTITSTSTSTCTSRTTSTPSSNPYFGKIIHTNIQDIITILIIDILILHSFYFLDICLDIFIEEIIFTMPNFIIQARRSFYNNLDHHCIDYIYSTTFIQQESYIILLFDIILNSTSRLTFTSNPPSTASRIARPSTTQSSLTLTTQSTSTTTASKHQRATWPSVRQSSSPTETQRRHRMSTSMWHHDIGGLRHHLWVRPHRVHGYTRDILPAHQDIRALPDHRWHRHLCLYRHHHGRALRSHLWDSVHHLRTCTRDIECQHRGIECQHRDIGVRQGHRWHRRHRMTSLTTSCTVG